jgi:SAM-dependent methyltransferase
VRPLAVARNLAKNASAAAGLRSLLRSGAYGMDGDLAAVLDVLERLAPSLADLGVRAEGLRVLELGPGRTPELLGAFVLAGAESGRGLDTRLQLGERARESDHYEPLAAALADGRAGAFLAAAGAAPDSVRERMEALRPAPWPVEFARTPGSSIPAADGSVDLLLSKSVLEHVAEPAVPALLDETYRVLRPGGGAVHMIDLRDHQWIDGDKRVAGDWLEALTYSPLAYRLQFSHRSTYTNRLREPAWRSAFERAGFVVAGWRATRFPLPDGFDPGRLRAPWRDLPPDTLAIGFLSVALQRP